jgi:hypothetical protein
LPIPNIRRTLLSSATQRALIMFAKPTSHHEWLHQLAGTWDLKHECRMGPDQPPSMVTGRVETRQVGPLWTLIDCHGETPEGGRWHSLFTLGYDAEKKKFVGTFVASMMTFLWIYEGDLDAEGKVLTLNVEGPSFDGQGMAQYQDIFEIVDQNHWILRSKMLNPSGQWVEFLVGHHRRLL